MNGRKLSDIRTSDVREILLAIAGSKARARTSLLNARNFLSGAFRFAVETDRIKHNPVRELNVAKITKEHGQRPTEDGTYAYSFDEIAAIVDALDEPARTVAIVAAFTGLRKGELMGLKWEDYTGDALHVRRSFWQSFETETKTESSEAPVPVIKIVKRALDAHEKRTHSKDGWIFKGERKGYPLNLNNVVRRRIVPALVKAKLEWHGWHAFRRGLGSNLHALGVADLDIMTILRHGDVETTRKHYVKIPPAAAVAAMKKLERALNGRK